MTVTKARHARPVHLTLAFLTVLYMVLIFYLSSQPDLDQPGPLGKVPNIDKVEHFLEFLLLALLMYLTFHTAGNGTVSRNGWHLALLGTVLYAIIDEVHQLFVPGRSPDSLDLLADSAGAALACLVGAVVSVRSARTVEGGRVMVPLDGSLGDGEE